LSYRNKAKRAARNKTASLVRKEKSAAPLKLFAVCALAFILNSGPVEDAKSIYGENSPSAGISSAVDADQPQQVFTEVKASWNVVDITQKGGRNERLAQWIGISNMNRNVRPGERVIKTDLIQAGALCDENGCRLFYELLPLQALSYRFTVNGGDRINAQISKLSGGKDLWLIRLNDQTKNITINEKVRYHSSQEAVQWILETPTAVREGNISLSELPRFNEAAFFDCSSKTDSPAPIKFYKLEITRNWRAMTKTETRPGNDNSIIIRRLRR
jgi:hypothetical protein